MSKDSMARDIEKWLKEVYKNDAIPAYEVNDRNSSVLYGAYLAFKESRKISGLYLQDLATETDGYQGRAQKMRSCFEAAFLGPSCLENCAQTTLRHLAACACTLNLKDLNDTSYLLAMTELKKSQLALERDRKKEELLHRKIGDSIVALMLRTEDLEKKLALIGDQPQAIAAEMEKMKLDSCLCEKKASVYNQKISLAKEQLKCAGVEYTMHHSTLVKQSLKLREMEKKCDLLSVKLGNFQGLPANRDLAIAEVEKLKEEIKGLDLKLTTAAKNAN